MNQREQQARDTRAKLLDAALRLFADKGVEQTSVKDIAREAGVAQGLLYHYFAGKDDLLWAVLETQSFEPRLQQTLADGEHRPAGDVLQSVAHELHAFMQSQQTWMRLVMGEIKTNARLRAVWEDSVRRKNALLTDFLHARVASGELRPHAAHALVFLLMHGVVALHQSEDRQTAGAETTIADMVDVLVRGVQAEKAHGGS